MAEIYLGNLSARDIADRLKINLNDADFSELNPLQIENAEKVHNAHGWHCYDIPFIIVCGDPDMTDTWIRILKPHNDEMAEPIRIAQDWGQSHE